MKPVRTSHFCKSIEFIGTATLAAAYHEREITYSSNLPFGSKYRYSLLP
jgi:hypothetical protein